MTLFIIETRVLLYPAVTRRGEGGGGENRCRGGVGGISFITVHANDNQIKHTKTKHKPPPPTLPPPPHTPRAEKGTRQY